MKIQDVLHRKGDTVAGIAPDASVREAVDALGRHDVGALVVRTGSGPVEGIVSERDVVRHLRTRGADVLDARVAELMTSLVATCAPGDDIEDAMRTMTERHVRHLPVVTAGPDGRLVGIVSIGDVVKNRIDELENTAEQLVGYINSGG